MRVARRIRPSRVGYGATVNRRRVHAAGFSGNESRKQHEPRVSLTFVIQTDGTVLSPEGEITRAAPDNQLGYAVAPDLVASSARG